MKKENIKVGMFVKVKSEKKCEELGWDFDENYFDRDFCGQVVEVVSNVHNTEWENGTYYDSVDVKHGGYRQCVPIHLLKKLKEDSNEQQ